MLLFLNKCQEIRPLSYVGRERFGFGIADYVLFLLRIQNPVN
jgi:hypothetical protein